MPISASEPLSPSPSALDDVDGTRVLGKVAKRLIPFIAMLYAFNILDRTNVGAASLSMKPDLGFSDFVYGLGAGMFFIGYFFFEVPSNLIMERVGARIWIARIMLTWGAISASMMFVRDAQWFYILRFALGVAEAGFYPGMILYLSYWFPTVQRATAISRFVAVSAVVGVLGGPLSAALLVLNGTFGLRGWQWLFLIEGVPSCLLGFAVLAYMTDKPADAKWLTPPERNWLMARLAAEAAHRDSHHGFTLAQALRSPQILHFCALFFLYVTAGYGIGFFVPQILKAQTPWPDWQIAFLSSLPGLAGAASMLWTAKHSDITCERKWHCGIGAAIGAGGVLLVALSGNPWLTLFALVIVNAGNGALQGPFWAMPNSVLTGAALAGGIAFINSVGNLGGFAGPYLMGWLKTSTGNYQSGLFVLAAMLLGAAFMAVTAKHDPALERAARDLPGTDLAR